WGKLTVLGLKNRYGYTKVIEGDEVFSGIGNIRYINTAVSGTSAVWGLENIHNNVVRYSADIVFIAFGMNNPKMDPAAFKDTLSKMIYEIRKDNPDCNIVLVATTHPNPHIVCTRGHREAFVPVLNQISDELEDIAVSDMTTLHSKLLCVKPYHHMTGNNINHPNDFLMRQYAIMALHALND
ncbi:MAG TPA: SGNH/GDSL hydrolase family protein, partial [Clostridia bacterium]|nr:SGNH/GDSL hydrolase family protein [Clostridia bacterium]